MAEIEQADVVVIGGSQRDHTGRTDAFDRRITSVTLDDEGKVTAVGGAFGVRSRASAIIGIQHDGRRQLSALYGQDGPDALPGLPAMAATEGAAQ